VSVERAGGGFVVLSIRKCAVNIYLCALLILVGEVEAGKTCLLRALRSVYLCVYIYMYIFVCMYIHMHDVTHA